MANHAVKKVSKVAKRSAGVVDQFKLARVAASAIGSQIDDLYTQQQAAYATIDENSKVIAGLGKLLGDA